VPSLRALLVSDIEVVAVVTNPDRPVGRKQQLRASPVKTAALDAGLEVQQPTSARDPDLELWLQEKKIDAAVVVAYGKILPVSLLEVPPLGFVNVHFSLLPAYRGAAPVQRALMDGVQQTGVALIVLTEGMDEGPILASRAVDVSEDDTADTLGARLSRIGAQMLPATLVAYATGEIEPEEQEHERATYAHKLTTEDARIDWTAPAEQIRNLIRGCNPEPGAWTKLRDKRVKILGAMIEADAGLGPGELAPSGAVGTGEGSLRPTEVQMEGKKAMGGQEMLRGLRLAPDEGFE